MTSASGVSRSGSFPGFDNQINVSDKGDRLPLSFRCRSGLLVDVRRISGSQHVDPVHLQKVKSLQNRVVRRPPETLRGTLKCGLPGRPPPAAMSTSTQKHRDFVGEPMGDKPVTSLSGIGGILGEKLRHQGFDKAYVVLGQFLLLKKDPEMFTEWLRDTSGANSRQAGLCSQCLREWCDAFL